MSDNGVSGSPASPAARVRAARRRDWGRTSLQVLAVAAFGVAAVTTAVWLGRREIARDALVDWLDRRGVVSEVTIERLDLDGFVGQIRAGPANDPDFVAERVEADFTLAMPWEKGGFAVKPGRVRLVRPVVKAALKDGELSFGKLDPLIDEFMAKPPRPEERGPRVLVEDGQLRLSTPWGLVRGRGDAVIDDNQLLRLDARLPRTRLSGRDLSADIEGARLHARKTGDRLQVTADGVIAEWVSDGLDLENARAGLEASLPYPDLKKRRGDGAVRATLALKADGAGLAEAQAAAAELNLRFDGQVGGWLQDFRLTGRAGASGRAESFTAGEFDGRGLRLEADAPMFEVSRAKDGLNWRARGDASVVAARARREGTFLEGARLGLTGADLGGRAGHGVEGVFQAGLTADRFADGDISLGGLKGDFRGDLRAGEAFLLSLNGGVSAARAAFAGMGPAKADDLPEIAAWKRALGAFRLSAPGLSLETGSPGTTLELTAPARLTPASGGEVILRPRRGRALYAASAEGDGTGGFDLTTSGGALPKAEIAVPTYQARFDGGALNLFATTQAKAAFDLGPVRGGLLETAGKLRLAGGVVTYTADRCARLTAERLEFGENDMTEVNGRLCAAGGPLFRMVDGAWTLSGRAEDVDVTGPFLEMRYVDAEGPLQASGRGDAIRASVRIVDAAVVDIAEARRFHPARAVGLVTLADDVWSGKLDLTTPAGVKLGELSLRHDGDTGVGGMSIETHGLTFRKEGLQPADVTPLVDPFDKAEGTVDFTGAFQWTPKTTTSEGRFSTTGLSFESPAGTVTQLAGDVRLTSLAPLLSAPDQRITVRRIDSLVALEEGTVEFQLLGDVLKIERGDVQAAGGRVVLEGFQMPFDPTASWEGAVLLEGVQLSEIVERSAFAEDLDLEAKVSGRLPFVVGPEGIRFLQGELHAIEPGRLSIKRKALTGMTAGGGEMPQLQENAAQDFAYQALEHLAFEQLEAQVNSLPNGRLGVLFHIKGEHAPPEHQEIRLTLADIIQRRFFDKQLPLPSGTRIDLTLDTSFNFDQLLEDFKEYNRAKSAR